MAPLFCLPDYEANQVCLEKLKGKWIVLYFYPRDNTPGCTLEAIDFTRSLNQFAERDTIVLGVSPDSPKSHCRFRDKHNLKVILLSDVNHSVSEQYGVWALKKLAGKIYYGVIRSTFIIDPDGRIKAYWKKVKVPGHVDDVFDKLRHLQE